MKFGKTLTTSKLVIKYYPFIFVTYSIFCKIKPLNAKDKTITLR